MYIELENVDAGFCDYLGNSAFALDRKPFGLPLFIMARSRPSGVQYRKQQCVSGGRGLACEREQDDSFEAQKNKYWKP